MINEPRLIRIANFQTSYHADINRLLTQLDPECTGMSEEHLRNILFSESSELYALELDGKLIGMTTLALYPCPTGWKAWIEDVVVDAQYRGKGYGKLLVNHAIDVIRKKAQTYGNLSLMLTSRPSRISANQLYQQLGFEKRETNAYKMEVSGLH